MRPFLLALLASPILATAAVDFSHQIVPVLREHCAECHAGDKKKGGFSFNDRASLLEGSENGPTVVAGSASKSRIIELMLSTDSDEQMPGFDERQKGRAGGDRVRARSIHRRREDEDEKDKDRYRERPYNRKAMQLLLKAVLNIL